MPNFIVSPLLSMAGRCLGKVSRGVVTQSRYLVRGAWCRISHLIIIDDGHRVLFFLYFFLGMAQTGILSAFAPIMSLGVEGFIEMTRLGHSTFSFGGRFCVCVLCVCVCVWLLCIKLFFSSFFLVHP